MTIFRSALTQGNLDNNHVYVTPFRGELPLDTIGGTNRTDLAPQMLRLEYESQTVETDVPSDKGAFRARGFFRRFFEATNAEAGDIVLFERLTPYNYRLSLERVDGSRVFGLPPEQRERAKQWVFVEARPDQQAFRRGIVERDGLRCAITGCEVPEVLEAAHVIPFKTEGATRAAPENGVILRADIHKLFDRLLIAIEPNSRAVSIAASLRGSVYEEHLGKIAATGAASTHLNDHFKRAGLGD